LGASKSPLSAIEIGMFFELSRGPEVFEHLRGRLALHPRSARERKLRADDAAQKKRKKTSK